MWQDAGLPPAKCGGSSESSCHMNSCLTRTICGSTNLRVGLQLSLAEGGGEGMVAYLETDGSFRPERVRQLQIADT